MTPSPENVAEVTEDKLLSTRRAAFILGVHWAHGFHLLHTDKMTSLHIETACNHLIQQGTENG